MKKKFLLVALTALAAALTVTAAGCEWIGNIGADGDSDGEPYYDTATVYAQAQGLGYKGTLEEFIDLISGKDGNDGKDGTGVKNGYINSDGHLIIVLTDDKEINCGSAVQLTHNHKFSEWILVKNADLTTGLEMRVCECGYSESKLTPPNENSGATTPDEPVEPGTPTDSDNSFVLPVTEANVSKGFYFVKDETLGSYRFHTGVDLSAPVGTEVFAVSDRTVSEIKIDDTNGTQITITHEDGVKFIYLYVAPISNLAVGDNVKRGNVIGTITEPTGNEKNEQPHLHFEIERNGRIEDPAEYLELS